MAGSDPFVRATPIVGDTKEGSSVGMMAGWWIESCCCATFALWDDDGAALGGIRPRWIETRTASFHTHHASIRPACTYRTLSFQFSGIDSEQAKISLQHSSNVYSTVDQQEGVAKKKATTTFPISAAGKADYVPLDEVLPLPVLLVGGR
jgi:hypothetical protein